MLRVCSQCGKSLEKDASRCVYCGSSSVTLVFDAEPGQTLPPVAPPEVKSAPATELPAPPQPAVPKKPRTTTTPRVAKKASVAKKAVAKAKPVTQTPAPVAAPPELPVPAVELAPLPPPVPQPSAPTVPLTSVPVPAAPEMPRTFPAVKAKPVEAEAPVDEYVQPSLMAELFADAGSFLWSYKYWLLAGCLLAVGVMPAMQWLQKNGIAIRMPAVLQKLDSLSPANKKTTAAINAVPAPEINPRAVELAVVKEFDGLLKDGLADKLAWGRELLKKRVPTRFPEELLLDIEHKHAEVRYTDAPKTAAYYQLDIAYHYQSEEQKKWVWKPVVFYFEKKNGQWVLVGDKWPKEWDINFE